MSVQQKIEKVELAMERLRWLPRDLGARHVFINQPAFNATYMHEGKAPLSMRAIVGKKSNQTNFFMDRIETVEYNPYWGVPRSIIVNEMLPKLFNDPSYLDQLGYEVTTVSGERVSSAWVDWYDVGVNKAPINVRQPPGRKNALGELKILFPNKHAIYMHDTPAKSLFQRNARAYSHGCVRLQKPREMAAAVLGKSTDYIASRIARGHNESDPVTANIPVYVAYFTAWPDPQTGAVSYYNDMYDRDTYLSRAIERTNSARHVES
jgi:murein L,D-transpeptidase YcbB/YkuD